MTRPSRWSPRCIIFSMPFFTHFFWTPLVASVCAPLRPLFVFTTLYITGFSFPSSWWCLRSFLALTWYNFNIVSRHLAASICAPHRPPSDCSTLFTWAIHSCHTANVALFCHHSFTPQGGPPVFPPTLSPGHHKYSLIEHFLLSWPLIQSLLICFQIP